MPLDPASVYPVLADTFPFIDPDQVLGTSGEEGDLVIDKIINAIRQIQATLGVASPAETGILAQVHQTLTAYTPSVSSPSSGIVCPHTATGFYSLAGHSGLVLFQVRATGAWTGSDIAVEVGLPSGWLTHPTHESARGTVFVVPPDASNPYGVHGAMDPVAHPAQNKLRFTCAAPAVVGGVTVRALLDEAFNGVTFPFQMTGTGVLAQQAYLWGAVEVWIQ